MSKYIKLLILVVLSTSIVSCGGKRRKPNIEAFKEMMSQESIKAQEGVDVKGDGTLAPLTPPKNTVARNRKVEKYSSVQDYLKSGDSLQNPLVDPELLKVYNSSLGKQKYDIYCSVCHGNNGTGAGVVSKYLLKKAPSLITEDYKKYSDGRLYVTIVQGWGMMKGYQSQITNENERWAIVNYIRTLQGDN